MFSCKSKAVTTCYYNLFHVKLNLSTSEIYCYVGYVWSQIIFTSVMGLNLSHYGIFA